MFRTGEQLTQGGRERRMLRALYAFTLALLILFLLATIATFNRYTVANKTIRDSNAMLNALEAMVSGLKDAQIGVQGYMLTHDTVLARPFRLAQPAVEASMRQLDSLQHTGTTTKDLSHIQDLSRQMLKMIQDQFLSERGSLPGLQGSEEDRVHRSQELMERIRVEHAGLVLAVESMRDRNLTMERSLQPDTPLMLLIFSVMAILATALLFWRLFRALAKAEGAEAEIQWKVDQLNREMRTREFAERSLKRVLDSSPSAIMAFRSIRDANGEVVDFEWLLANRESERVYSRTHEPMIGKRLLRELPEMAEDGLYDAFLEVVETGTPFESTRQSALRQGAWVHLHALRLLDGFVVTITDVSEARRAQDLLAEADRLAITGGIARTIAHEVRNPLTNLRMALEQLTEELPGEVRDETTPFTDILRRNILRIGKLISDLLESSRPHELDRQPCNMADLLEAAVASVQDRLDLQHMRARVEVDPALPRIMADPDLLGVALTNLCVNAIEAMEEGKGQLLLKAWLQRGRVHASITDNGKGIPEENIQRLFQAFYSGHSGGMGLGLTSARTILNAHGVHMNVESTVGEGTTFTLTFPG